jgi:hypothetical protein
MANAPKKDTTEKLFDEKFQMPKFEEILEILLKVYFVNKASLHF